MTTQPTRTVDVEEVRRWRLVLGKDSQHEALARKLSALGIPCFGCTPQRLPELLEGALKGADLKALASRITANAATP